MAQSQTEYAPKLILPHQQLITIKILCNVINILINSNINYIK